MFTHVSEESGKQFSVLGKRGCMGSMRETGRTRGAWEDGSMGGLCDCIECEERKPVTKELL